MFDRIVHHQTCPHCTELNPTAVSKIIEMDRRRLCCDCGNSLSLHVVDELPDDVSAPLFFLIGRYGFRLHGDVTYKDETRCKHNVTEMRYEMVREDGAGCVMSLFELPLEDLQRFRTAKYSRKGLGRHVPDSLHDVAEFLANDCYQFALTDKQLSDSPLFVRFEKRRPIPIRGCESPKCLVLRVELNWTSVMHDNERRDSTTTRKRNWGTRGV